MSRNGSGTYVLPTGNPVVTGTTITSNWANTTLSDIATALTGSVAADGQTPMTGVLQMGGNKVTSLATPTTTTDASTKGYVDTTVAALAATLGTMSTQNANNVAITGGTISGLSSPLPVASGGTSSSSLTANNVLLGNGTSALQVVAPSTAGNVLTSNGTTWTSAPPTVGVFGQLFTSSGTFTVPAGVTKLKIICIGGGGGAASDGKPGGFGGYAEGYYTVTSGSSYSVTVGGGGGAGSNGGTSSFSSLISATGGSGATTSTQGTDGNGASGTNRNTNISVPKNVFVGSYIENIDVTGGGQTWSISSIYSAGTHGGNGSSGYNCPGFSGIVSVEW